MEGGSEGGREITAIFFADCVCQRSSLCLTEPQ